VKDFLLDILEMLGFSFPNLKMNLKLRKILYEKVFTGKS